MKLNRREFIQVSALSVAGTIVSAANVSETQRRAATIWQHTFKAQDGRVRALLARMPETEHGYGLQY